jgi:hypothetical protein
MNIEMFFVQSYAREQLLSLLRQRLSTPPDVLGNQSSCWGLPASYDVLLVKERKRKIAISPLKGDWIAGIESKEVVDFALLQGLSQQLCTRVIAIQLSEVSGCCGYACCDRGKVIETYFSEDDEDPQETIVQYLQQQGVQHKLVMFREIAQSRNLGWTIVSARG